MGLLDQLNEVLVQQPRKYWGDKATRLGSLLSDSAATGAQAYGSANSPMAPEHANTLAGLLADFTPGLGDVKSAYDGMQSAREGDYLGAALGGLGALPLVPNLGGVLKGWHGSNDLINAIDLSHKGKNFPDYSLGFHISSDKDEAAKYGKNLYGVEVDAKNPLVVRGEYPTQAIDEDLAEIRYKLLEAIKSGSPHDAIHSYGKDGTFNAVVLDPAIAKILK